MAESTYVKDKYNRGVQEIRSELRSYWLNHSFMLGYQWTFWNWDQRRLDNLANEGDRIQATVNRTRANMRTIMGNLTQRELTFENPPQAYDDASIRSARVGEAAIYDIAKAHFWETHREKLLYAVVKGGTAATSVDWDPVNKETVETLLAIGDFIVEPGVTEARKARYWVRRQALPQDEVWSMFREEFPDDPPAQDSVNSLDPYMHRIVGDNLGFGSELVPFTHVYTYYERPNPLCPDGKIMVEVDGRIVQHIEKWPFPFKDRLNLVPIVETPVENRWYGATFMDDIRPLQVALNAAWSNLLEHLRDAGVARMMVPSSAVDLINSISDQPGEIMEYPDGVTPPQYLTPAQLSSWLRDLPDMLSTLIDDGMGVHDVTRGRAPANIESGLGIQILTENDNSPSGRLIREVARHFSEVSQMVLMILEQEVKGQVTTTIMDGTSPVRYEWTGADINGAHGIYVPVEAIMPVNKAAMAAEAQKMLEMGLITDISEYIAIAQTPRQDDILAAVNPDLAKARRENAAFVLGEVPLPADFDDHPTHIQSHNDFRKTQRYEQLDAEDQETADLHIQAHETMAAEEAANAMQDMSVGGPALAAAPNADGSMIDPALLQAPGIPPMPGQEAPLPVPEAPPEAGPVDPNQMIGDLMSDLEP